MRPGTTGSLGTVEITAACASNNKQTFTVLFISVHWYSNLTRPTNLQTWFQLICSLSSASSAISVQWPRALQSTCENRILWTMRSYCGESKSISNLLAYIRVQLAKVKVKPSRPQSSQVCGVVQVPTLADRSSWCDFHYPEIESNRVWVLQAKWSQHQMDGRRSSGTTVRRLSHRNSFL